MNSKIITGRVTFHLDKERLEPQLGSSWETKLFVGLFRKVAPQRGSFGLEKVENLAGVWRYLTPFCSALSWVLEAD